MHVDIGGGRLFYESVGRGRTVVVLHGGPGLDHTYFRPWLDPLAEAARLVFVDLPGNGRSRELSPQGGIEPWADAIERFREAMSIDRLVLLGHSFGGYVAQEYALGHADRLDGLVLANTAPAFDYAPTAMANAAARATPEQLAALQAGLSAPVPDDAAFQRIWDEILPIYFERYEPAIRAAFDERTSYSAAAFNAGMASLATWSSLARLGGLKVPTLVLSSRHDWITPVEWGGERIGKAVPGAELVLFEKSGHFPFMEERDAFVAALRRWIERLG